MYKLQAILGLISKIFSNIILVICLPISLILFAGSIIHASEFRFFKATISSVIFGPVAVNTSL